MLRARHAALVTENLRLVEAIATSMLDGLPEFVQFEDLYSPGQVGLLEAAQTFNPARGVQFSSYAKFRIRGAMLDYLRSIDPISRDARKFTKAMDAAREQIAAAGEQVTDEAIATHMGIPLERFRSTRSSLVKSIESTDAPRWMDDSDPLSAVMKDRKSIDPEAQAVISSMKRLLAEAIEQLPHRYQIAVQLYFYDELTMKEVGVVLGINESRVSQIVSAAIARSRAWMNARGYRAFAQVAV